jgi:serine/threonine protein kinase
MTVHDASSYVGRYQLGRTLGEGSFAKVKLATDRDTGSPVAIKIIDKDKILKVHKMVSFLAPHHHHHHHHHHQFLLLLLLLLLLLPLPWIPYPLPRSDDPTQVPYCTEVIA